MRAAILTDFIGHDPAYSLCRVVRDQVEMITRIGGYALDVVVNQGFNDDELYTPARIIRVDPGRGANNTVEVTEESEAEIEHLTKQLLEAFIEVGVVLTHDLIYQPNQWRWHVAARRVARQRPDLQWLHWVHSATNMDVAEQTGQFAKELRGPFPNSRLVVMHSEERLRKMQAYGYEPHQTVIVPNTLDIAADYHPIARQVIEKGNLWHADCVIVYPCRLDRGKQPHILIEIAAELIRMHVDTRVVIVDFHSTAGDKEIYRNEMRQQAQLAGVPVQFTSDIEPYLIPHQAVMDLFDFADMFVHPSKSESDPLILQEAMWKRNGLILNFDLPLFRSMCEETAFFYKFSSCIDVTTGEVGETNTQYRDRRAYMRMVAGGIAYQLRTDPVLTNHVRVRKERSLYAVWERNLWPALASIGPLELLASAQAEPDPNVSIVIPCYLMAAKQGELLTFTQNCVASIRHHMPYAHIVLVDNGSEIGREWMAENADLYLRNDGNLGFAKGVNAGIEAQANVFDSDWVIVCNNDVEFVHDWARKAISAWSSKTGIISSHLLDHDPQMRVGREVPRDPVGYFFGACWMVSKDVLGRIGNLDEGYVKGYYEDKDYVQRLVKAGYEVVKIGHVKHIGNATSGKMPDMHDFFQANKERYEARWGGKKK
jgi:GT2 family glycosyltransferase/glycosyltransferase involved in cell wall biosynthesis